MSEPEGSGEPRRGAPVGEGGEAVVGSEGVGRRLDEVVAALAGVSRTRAARWAEEGRVLVDDLSAQHLVSVHGPSAQSGLDPAATLSVLESVLNGISAL